MSRAIWLSLVLAAFCGTVLASEEKPSSATPRPSSNSAADQPAAEIKSPLADKKPAAKRPAGEKPTIEKAAAKAALPQEHVIYVPYKNLRAVFEKEDSSIMLPYAQFLEMWKRLTPPDPQAVKPPVNGAITRADYSGAVVGELARLEATLDVEVLCDDWAQLPVQFGNAAIGAARSADGAVLLRGVGEGKYELLVQGKGRHQVKLSLVAPVKSAADGRTLVVQCPAVGVSNLDLDLPEKDLAVHVTPQRTSDVKSDPQGVTHLRAVLGATNSFTVSWQPKSGGADQAAGLANVVDTIAVDIGDGVVHTQATLEYQILRGSLSELVVEVPADQRLLDVQTPGLRDWQTEQAGPRQRVKVRLHAPASESVKLELRTEAPLTDKAFEVGAVRAVGAARESGTLAVRSGEDLGLEFVQREALNRIDAADAPAALKKPNSTFYRFFTPDHKLAVVAAALKPRIVVASRHSVLLEKARVTTRGEFAYQISRSGVFSVQFRLPGGLQVDEVRAASLERFDVAPAGGEQMLTAYFTKRLTGDFKVSVTASQVRDKPDGELPLPLIEPLGSTREEGLVAVIAPESLELKTDATKLRSARAATPAELAAQGFQPQTPGGMALAAAFSYVTRPVSIVQSIALRPRRMSAVVGTVASVKEDVVQVTTTLRYHIQFAGADAFRLAVPAAVADRLQIDGEGIKERRKAPQAAADGTLQWTVVLHSEALGARTFTATYDQKISTADRGAAFELHAITPLDVDRESGEIAIHKDRSLSVAAKPTGLEEIDPRELSLPVGPAQPYLAYRYFQHPAHLLLTITKHELQDVVKTVVRRAYIEAVVTEDGPLTVRARYDLKSNERQRLAVTLPNPRILGITVAGQSVAPEKAPPAAGGSPDDKTYFINVARAADSNEPFQIATVFETPRPTKDLKVTDVLRLPLPRFDAGVKFQKVYVRLWVPKGYRLVGDPAGFNSHIGVGLWDSRQLSEQDDNPDSWFSKDATAFDFQVGGTTYLFSSLADPGELSIKYWHIPAMTTIASLVVLAIGIALLAVTLETKVLVILAAGFAALFAGLFWPSTVNSWLLAGRIGVGCVIALWLVVWLLHVRRSGALAAAFAGGTPPPSAAPSPAPANTPAVQDSPAAPSDKPEGSSDAH